MASTGESSNSYVSKNTNDKLFLLSYAEVTNSDYGLQQDASRMLHTSDYSRATGVDMVGLESSNPGGGYWWLRSPYSVHAQVARYVSPDGHISFSFVDNVQKGVVPAMNICLP